MSIDIPSDLMPFVHQFIATGRCNNESEVVGEALRLLEVVERKRAQLRADVLEGIDSGTSVSRDEVLHAARDTEAFYE